MRMIDHLDYLRGTLPRIVEHLYYVPEFGRLTRAWDEEEGGSGGAEFYWVELRDMLSEECRDAWDALKALDEHSGPLAFLVWHRYVVPWDVSMVGTVRGERKTAEDGLRWMASWLQERGGRGKSRRRTVDERRVHVLKLRARGWKREDICRELRMSARDVSKVLRDG